MECEFAFKQVGAVHLNCLQCTRSRTQRAIEVNRPYLCRVAYFNATVFEMSEQVREMFAIPDFDRAQNVDG